MFTIVKNVVLNVSDTKNAVTEKCVYRENVYLKSNYLKPFPSHKLMSEEPQRDGVYCSKLFNLVL